MRFFVRGVAVVGAIWDQEFREGRFPHQWSHVVWIVVITALLWHSEQNLPVVALPAVDRASANAMSESDKRCGLWPPGGDSDRGVGRELRVPRRRLFEPRRRPAQAQDLQMGCVLPPVVHTLLAWISF
eukprot:1751445-Rhodomonas_salina.2